MTTANPYTGQQGMEWYELAWDQGYQYGTEHPDQDQPTPPTVFPPLDQIDNYLNYLQQVWNEGDLAARTDHHPNVQHHQPTESGLDTAEHVIDATHLTYDVGKMLVTGAVTVGEIGATAIGILVALIGMTEPSDQEQAEQDLQNWFSQACREYNCTEFFLAVEWPSGEQATGWYGPQVHNTFEPAKDDAAGRLAQNPDSQVQVAHYRADSPGIIEMISLIEQ